MDFNNIFDRVLLRINPIAFWRREGVKIGIGCSINRTVSFDSEPYLISIGNNVRVNEKVMFVTHDGGMWVLRNIEESFRDADLFGEIHVGDNVHIGTASIIMPGVSIGSNVIIGCGSVVTRSVPDNSVVAGIPARIIETIEEYKSKHLNQVVHTKHMDVKEKRRYLENCKDLRRDK